MSIFYVATFATAQTVETLIIIHDFETNYDSSSGASDQSASDESESENEF